MQLSLHDGLQKKADTKGFVYVECMKGMCGLPYSGIIAQRLLKERLNAKDYYQSSITPGFWTHKWCPIFLSLIVDNFGVRYVGEGLIQHLLGALFDHHKVTNDWKGNKYTGISINWDYDKRQVHLLMT